VFKRLGLWWSRTVNPLASIACELQIIRELLELEFASRGIRRVTETPKASDTEVTYGDAEHKVDVFAPDDLEF
jgi:hypothetical protein